MLYQVKAAGGRGGRGYFLKSAFFLNNLHDHYLVVVIATTRYCSGVQLISVVIFVNSRVDSLMSGAHAPPDVRETFGIPERNFAVLSGYVGNNFVIFRR